MPRIHGWVRSPRSRVWLALLLLVALAIGVVGQRSVPGLLSVPDVMAELPVLSAAFDAVVAHDPELMSRVALSAMTIHASVDGQRAERLGLVWPQWGSTLSNLADVLQADHAILHLAGLTNPQVHVVVEASVVAAARADLRDLGFGDPAARQSAFGARFHGARSLLSLSRPALVDHRALVCFEAGNATGASATGFVLLEWQGRCWRAVQTFVLGIA